MTDTLYTVDTAILYHYNVAHRRDRSEAFFVDTSNKHYARVDNTGSVWWYHSTHNTRWVGIEQASQVLMVGAQANQFKNSSGEHLPLVGAPP